MLPGLHGIMWSEFLGKTDLRIAAFSRIWSLEHMVKPASTLLAIGHSRDLLIFENRRNLGVGLGAYRPIFH